MTDRFVLIEDNPEFPTEAGTCWYWDTHRPQKEGGQPYVTVQCYRDRDPNNYVKIELPMKLLFTDQAEYYAVCPGCYYKHRHQQWSGGTRNPNPNWREQSEITLKLHQERKGWCEFCDPVFGNGGWQI